MIRSTPSIHLLVIALLLVACPTEEVASPEVDDDDAAQVDDDDAAPLAYSGPAYTPCVTEAQCDPGSACTVVPGFGGTFCSPSCDPAGDGSECALEGLPFDVMCLETGRCARHCADGEEPVAPDVEPPDEPRADDDPRCPNGLTCRSAADDALCAGSVAGIAGYYGICSHPNIDGSECPPASSCFGGQLIGSESGVCLPWCDSGSCPDATGVQNATPYCYDVTDQVDIGHPVCALLCNVGDPESICPTGQICFDIGFGGVGLCSPPDAVAPPF